MRSKRKAWGMAVAAALALLLSLAPGASARLRGELDPSFGHGGRVLLGHGPTYAKAGYSEVALAPDGSAVFAGHTESIQGKYIEQSVLIQRRLPDGHLDPGFRRVADHYSGLGAAGLALAPGGAILYAVGESYVGSVRRLLPDGRPDTSFGKEGTAAVPLAPFSLAVDAEGRVLVAGGAPIGGDCHDCVPSPVEAVARLLPDGSLDNSFGKEGIVILGPSSGRYGATEELAIEPDGSIVAGAGKELFGLTASGAPNPAFGREGVLELEAESSALAESASGDLITAGSSAKSCCGRRGQFVLHAYRPNGALDQAWGSGGSLAIAAGDVVTRPALAPGPDGTVTLAGEVAPATEAKGCKKCAFRPYFARVTAAGAVDSSFSSDLGAAGDGATTVAALAVTQSGAVVAAGSSEPSAPGGEQATALALSPSGILDGAYGRGGIASERESLPSSTVALGFAAGPGGKLVAAYETNAGGSEEENLAIGAWGPDGGRLGGYGGSSKLVYSRPQLTLSADGRGRLYRIEGNSNRVRRFGTDGRLERGYGSNGGAQLPESFEPRRLAVKPDGTVLVIGRVSGEDEMALYELSSAGRPERSFGRGGLLRIPSAAGLKAEALAVSFDRSGRIVLFGTVERQTLLFRLLPDGRPDPSFGRRGRVDFRPLLSTRISSVNVARDGRIYLVTSSSGGRETTLVRFRANGARDRSFGRGGVVQFEAQQPLLAFFPGPRQLVLVCGEGSFGDTGLTLRAFDLDGSCDRSFGDRGVFRGSPGELGDFGPIGVVRQPGGRIVIAGTQRPNRYGESLELVRFR